MKATVSMQGVPDVEAALRRITQAIGQAQGAVMERAAQPIAERMRETVAVDSGETRDSITVQQAEGGAEVVAGGAAALLEFGTSRMRAQPFARPAVDQEKASILAEAGRGVEAVVRENA